MALTKYDVGLICSCDTTKEQQYTKQNYFQLCY